MKKMKSFIPVLGVVMLGTVSYGACWKLVELNQTACEIAYCELNACGPVDRTTDEKVYLKISDSPGREAVDVNALCHLSYEVKNIHGQCVVPWSCEGLVGSWVLTGGFCPESLD